MQDMAAKRRDAFRKRPYFTFFLLWVPLLGTLVAEPLTGLVDTSFVATLGVTAQAALGIGTVVMTSSLLLFNFLSVGTQTSVALALGKGDWQRGRRMGSCAFFFAFFLGLLLSLLIWGNAPFLAILMGAKGQIYTHAVCYIRIRALGGPAVLISLATSGILYGRTEMRLPLIIATCVNILNVLLDGILIFGHLGMPALGIAGAAAATSISQWVGAIISSLVVFRKMGVVLIIHRADVQGLFVVGRDMVLRTALAFFFLLFATRVATVLGAEVGAAHQAIRQVSTFIGLFLDAAAIAGQSLIALFLGAEDVFAARKVAKFVCCCSVVIGGLLALLMLAGTPIFATFLVPVQSRSLFIGAWCIAACFQPVAACAYATDGIHWGTGDFAFLRNSIGIATCIGSLALIWCEQVTSPSLSGVWWVIGMWLTFRAVLGILRIWPGVGKAPLSTREGKIKI